MTKDEDEPPDYDDDFDFEFDEGEPGEEREPDPKTEQAKVVLEEFFRRNPRRVFYQRQLQVIFERDFFHWVTVRALRELVDEGKIASASHGHVKALGGEEIRFFWPRGLRYWRRDVARLTKVIVTELSNPTFTHAIGKHGEMMFDAALGRIGFSRLAKTVRSWNGKDWKETGHNLDRIYRRDGVEYGAEVKNTLAYIPEDELSVKLEMCSFFGVRPLFIMRFAPKTYNHRIITAGGYAWIFEDQLYPFGMEEKARRVRHEMGLKVDAPTEVPEGMVTRFENWHRKTLGL
jgi:hypothetical protein